MGTIARGGLTSPVYLFGLAVPTCIALVTQVIEIAPVTVLTVLARAIGAQGGTEQTTPGDYQAAA